MTAANLTMHALLTALAAEFVKFNQHIPSHLDISVWQQPTCHTHAHTSPNPHAAAILSVQFIDTFPRTCTTAWQQPTFFALMRVSNPHAAAILNS
eukprot:1157237-Pelagomonas_calceolata.AAC.2